MKPSENRDTRYFIEIDLERRDTACRIRSEAEPKQGSTNTDWYSSAISDEGSVPKICEPLSERAWCRPGFLIANTHQAIPLQTLPSSKYYLQTYYTEAQRDTLFLSPASLIPQTGVECSSPRPSPAGMLALSLQGCIHGGSWRGALGSGPTPIQYPNTRFSQDCSGLK